MKRLNRATLARQLLLAREPLSTADGVRRVVALQAQSPASPYLALWNRLSGFDPAALDAAFADGTVVRATLVRMTLHAVHAEDWPILHGAMAPRLRDGRLHDNRYTGTGLSDADGDALLPALAEFAGTPRTGADIEAMLAERSGAPGRWVWWALRTFAPLRHVPTGGPWAYGPPPATYVAAAGSRPHEEAVQDLVLRYLQGFGPATMQDIGQFSLMTQSAIRRAVAGLGDRLIRLDGRLLDVPGGVLPDEDTIAPPRLLPMWDSILLAYADRSRVVPPAYRPVIFRRNGDVLPAVLVDGQVAGVWRATGEGVEITAFHPLDDATWHDLETEARSLLAFLAGREPLVYRRYGHWWAKDLPAAEVRTVGH
ncbi:winged helix DNA-binding domain-containing protein [Catenuloplanes nepalensis]|nr:winged helix DNA-binding domain-containing protein [Catenuloplanes nepalensis]